MRKSDAARTPRANPFGISSTVGRPAPAHSATWSKPPAKASSTLKVPPKRTPPNIANRRRRSSSRRMILRKFLSQRTVMPYSATPPKPAITRRSRSSRNCLISLMGWKGTRLPSGSTPDAEGSSGSIFRPSMATTVVSLAHHLMNDGHTVAVDGDHGVAVVHQVVRQRESGRAEPDNKDSFPGCRFWIRATNVEGVPAREQRVDLEAPRQFENVLQRARLGLRDVDRLLLLVDAGLHAVVADAVPGGGQHRVVDGDDAERGERLAARLHHMKLGDLLLERAARQRDAEHGLAESLGGRLFLEAFRARVLSLLVAPDAVVRLVERADQVGAAIGQLESVAMAQVLRGMLRKAILGFAVNRDQPHVVELPRRLEQHAGAVLLASLGTRRSPRCVARGGFALRCMRCFVLQPLAHLLCKLQFRERATEDPILDRLRVNRSYFFRLDLVQGTPLHELALHRVERRKLVVFFRERAGLGFDAEELRQEILDVRSERDQQV